MQLILDPPETCAQLLSSQPHLQVTKTRTVVVLNPCAPELLCYSPRACTVNGVCPTSSSGSGVSLASYDLTPPVITLLGAGSDLAAGGRVIGRQTTLTVSGGAYVDPGKRE
jgi:hypothetical protein